MSACSFSTCSGEQHSQNSFLLLSFFTMLGDVQLILALCLSCAIVFSSSLIQKTHCLHRRHFSLPQHDKDTAGRRVCGLHSRLIYIVSKRKRELGNRADWSTDLSLSRLSNLFRLSIVVAKCLACSVIHQTGLQFLLFCSMSIRNTTPHTQSFTPNSIVFSMKSLSTKHIQCQTAVQSRG